MKISMNLYPLVMILFFVLFFIFSEMIINMLSLVGFSIMMMICLYELSGSFWTSSIMIMIMTTGILVVFTFIVSVQSKFSSSFWSVENFMKLFTMTMILFSFFLMKKDFLYNSFFEYFHVSFFGSTVLVLLLIILMVIFMQLTHSKGGGFRKNF